MPLAASLKWRALTRYYALSSRVAAAFTQARAVKQASALSACEMHNKRSDVAGSQQSAGGVIITP